MQVQVKEIAGKVLVAYEKGTSRVVGEARRVNVETGERRKERWLVQEGNALVGIMPSWDASAKYFRDEGHTVKSLDSRVHDMSVEEKSFAPIVKPTVVGGTDMKSSAARARKRLAAADA